MNRLRLFRIVLILSPLLILGFFEGTLRLLHYGNNLELFVPLDTNRDYLIANPDVALRYFDDPHQTGFGADDVFKVHKDTTTIRIFVLGGSTTAGFPYFFNGSFSRSLQDILSQTYPERNFEVVNLGMTAVNSYTVREFAKECLAFEPDLLVIYAGHNEFYGALGTGSVSALPAFLNGQRWLTLFFQNVKRLRLYQLIRSVILRAGSSETKERDRRTLMERMVKDRFIAYNSPLYRKTLAIFHRNLADIIRWSRESQVPVVFGTLVSNLRDQPPFISLHSIPVEDTDYREQLDVVEELIKLNRYQTAFETLEILRTQDSSYALTNYLAGQCEEAFGQYPQARYFYRQAKDLDALRFRAPSELNTILKGFSTLPGVFLADIETAFNRASPNGIPGSELFLEHLHPNLNGQFLIAKTFANEIIHQRLFGPPRRNISAVTRDLEKQSWDDRGVTPLDRKIAEYQIRILISNWPFTQESSLSINDLRPGNRVEETAIDVLKKKLNYKEAHLRLAQEYQNTGRFDSAIIECKALIKAFPYNQNMYRALGSVYLTAKQYGKALPVLQQALKFGLDLFSLKWGGIILLKQQRPNLAVYYLETAKQLDPGDPQIRYNLSGAYAQIGNPDQAIAEIDMVLQINPEYPYAREFRQRLLANGNKQ